MMFFTGDHARNTILRICSSFSANIYPFPPTRQENEEQVHQINERLHTMESVERRSIEQNMGKLMQIKIHFKMWMKFVAREKAIFH